LRSPQEIPHDRHESTADHLRDANDTATERLKDVGDSARDMAANATEQARQYGQKAQDQPMTTIAGAAAIGFLQERSGRNSRCNGDGGIPVISISHANRQKLVAGDAGQGCEGHRRGYVVAMGPGQLEPGRPYLSKANLKVA
jgi:ElaB/YqjD/DUF883 family membrane-anchored ribosome-binding protein